MKEFKPKEEGWGCHSTRIKRGRENLRSRDSKRNQKDDGQENRHGRKAEIWPRNQGTKGPKDKGSNCKVRDMARQGGQGPRDQMFRRSRVQGPKTKRPWVQRDRRTRGSRVQEAKRPEDQETRRPEDQGSRRPMAKRPEKQKKSRDQEAKDQEIRGPRD